MDYLGKKSRKRGGVYKKSRQAKRRMTGGENQGKWSNVMDNSGDWMNRYTICKNGCCKWRNYNAFGKKNAPKNIDDLVLASPMGSSPEGCKL